MRQFFAVKKENNILYLDKKQFNHIKNVLRMKEGSKIEVVYSDEKYIASLNSDYLTCNILKNLEKEAKKKIKKIFYIPVLVEDKMSFIFQKGTELGVDEFVPLLFERCKIKLDENTKIKKINRWKKIVENASMQSKRIEMPKVSDIVIVNEILPNADLNLLCSLDTDNVKTLKEVLNNVNSCATISVLFGPEGGLTSAEEEILVDKGFIKTKLCNNVLRTETVVLYVGSVIDYLYEGE